MSLIAFQQKVASIHDDIRVLTYTKRSEPSRVQHSVCSNEYDIMPRVLLTGCRCPYCDKSSKTKNHEDFAKKVLAMTNGEYSVLPEPRWVSSSQKVRFLHSICGQEYDGKPQLFINGRRCAVCAGKKKRTQESFEEQVRVATDGGYIVLGNYVNGETPIMMKHIECSHEWCVRPANFLNRSNRCPRCCTINTRSKGYEMVADVLKCIGIEFVEEARIIKSPKTGRSFIYDFFIPSIRAAIEFDGKTQYEETRFNKRKEGLIAQQLRDELKNEISLLNGISILRIHYTLTYKPALVLRIIKQFLHEANNTYGMVISSEASHNGGNVQRLSKAHLTGGSE